MAPETEPAPARVFAASDLQGGDPFDLTVNDGGNLIALYSETIWQTGAPVPTTIREFTPTLSLVGAGSQVGNQTGSFAAGKSWSEVGRIEQLGTNYVVLRGGMLHYAQFDPFGIPIGAPPADPSTDLSTFPAAYYPLAMVLVDLDGTGGKDVVLATESGQVVWLPNAVVTSGDMTPITGLLAAHPHAHSTGGVVASWGMVADDLDGDDHDLHVIDQTGRQWSVATRAGTTLPGTPTLERVVFAFKPFRDLGRLGWRPDQELPQWVDIPAPLLPDLFRLRVKIPVRQPGTNAHLPGDWRPAQFSWDVRPHNQWIFGPEAWLPFHFGGHVAQATPTSRRFAYWFSGAPNESPGQGHYANLILGVDSAPGGGSGAFHWWSSAWDSTVGSPTPFCTYRNVVLGDVGYDQQSLRLGFWPEFPRAEPYFVVGTSGGGILIGDPTQPPDLSLVFPKTESQYFTNERDEGYGGMALAVATVRGLLPTIFFGTLHTHADDELRDMVSSLHLWTWAGAGQPLTGHDYVLDGSGGRPKLYGVCGLAVGDLLGPDPDPDGVAEELVVTTLNGDLVVFDLEPGEGQPADENVKLGPRLYWKVFDGALGACNALWIDDLDGDGTNELYVATTIGIRKLTPAE